MLQGERLLSTEGANAKTAAARIHDESPAASPPMTLTFVRLGAWLALVVSLLALA